MSRIKFTAFSRALAAFLGLTALVIPLRAYDLIRGPGGAVVKWEEGTAPLVLRLPSSPTFSDGTNFSNAVAGAVQTWNQQLSRLQLVPQILPAGAAGSNNGISEVALDSRIYSSEPNSEAFGANVLAVTISYRSQSVSEDGSFRRTQSDILFNSAIAWDSYRGSLRTAIDVRRVALHELGHLLGLDHPDENGQSVAALMNSYVTDLDALALDDLMGAQLIYGRPGGFSPPANDNFSNAIALGGVATAVVGSSVGATREIGEPAHVVGQIDGASVWWKWTAPAYGSVVISTAGSNFDTVLAVYSGSAVESLQRVASNDDDPQRPVRTSRVTFHAVGGVTYFIAAAGWQQEWGDVQLSLNYVQPPTWFAPSFSWQPESISTQDGDNVSFAVGVVADPTASLRWQRQAAGSSTWVDLGSEASYSGAETDRLTIREVSYALNGDLFRCVASNPVGSATSQPATLTVVPRPPFFYIFPQDVETVLGGSATINANVRGTPSIGYEWRDPAGNVIPGVAGPTLTLSNVQAGGTYSIRAFNPYGSVTRSFRIILVSAPVISSQPQGSTIHEGELLWLSASVSGAGSLQYQWYRNGAAVPNARSPNIFQTAALSDAGTYTLVATNISGSVTSSPAEVIVLPRPIATPVLESSRAIVLGERFWITLGTSGAWGSSSFQWYRDGVALAGETASTYEVSAATTAHLGDYQVTVTNSAGTAVSNTLTLTARSDGDHYFPPSPYWRDAVEFEGVVYFIFADTPRILRYSLVTESWLAPWTLPSAPSAIAVTADSIFVGAGTTITRYDRNLSNGATVATDTGTVTALLVRDRQMFAIWRAATNVARVIDLQTQQTLGSREEYYLPAFGAAYNPANRDIYLVNADINPADLHAMRWNDDGTLGTMRDTPYHGEYPAGLRHFVIAQGTKVANSAGVVYAASDLTYLSGIVGGCTDLLEAADGSFVALTRGYLSLHDAQGRKLATRKLQREGTKLSVRNGRAFVFARPSAANGSPEVEKIELSAVTAPSLPEPLSPHGREIWSPRVFADALGNVYVYSPLDRMVFRWSANEAAYLESVPLAEAPGLLVYSPEHHALLYGQGFQLRKVALSSGSAGSGADQPFFPSARRIGLLQPMGRALFLLDYHENSRARSVATDGTTRRHPSNWISPYTLPAWHAGTNQIFLTEGVSTYSAFRQSVIDGVFGAGKASPASLGGSSPRFIRVSPDAASAFLSSGHILSTPDMTVTGFVAGKFTDATWSAGFLFTLVETGIGSRVSRLDSAGNVFGVAEFAGRPLGLFTAPGGSLVLVTTDYLRPTFRLLSPQSLDVLSPSSLAGAPQLVETPKPQAVKAGRHAVFSVVATGTAGMSYQWRRNGQPLAESSRFRGTRGQVLLVENVGADLEGSYDVVVSNGLGSVITTAVPLTVHRSVQQITFAPLSDMPLRDAPLSLTATSSSGLPVTFSVLSGPARLAGSANTQLHLEGIGGVRIRAAQDGNDDYFATAIEQSFTVWQTPEHWLAMRFTADEFSDPAMAGFGADPDHDGMPNLLEYALGLDPRKPDAQTVAGIRVEDADWAFTFEMPAGLSGVTIAVETSTDLATWTGAISQVIAQNGDRMTYEARVPRAGAAPVFFRIRAVSK